MKKGKEKKR